jgi:GrpB-like predicted nucleotidyltransferase (UPF0157 family)
MSIMPGASPTHDEVISSAVERWKARRSRVGRRVTLLDLYQDVADARGVEPHELARAERRILSALAFSEIWPGFEVIGDERPDPVEIVAYDRSWPVRFESWKERLSEALRMSARRIEHVGSTAVQGLAAKPTIDIQISVDSLEREEDYVPGLTACGLELRSRDRLHRYLRPPPDRPRDVHVHVCKAGGDWEREHLLFRDFLRAHPAAAERYATSKRALADRWRDDRPAYTEAKTAIILETLAAAEQWAQERR